MKRMLKSSVAAAAFCVLLAEPARAAEAEASAPGLYQPRTTAQLPPMRVAVIDGIRLRDIETGAVYRLSGIETCAPGQTATLGRQPWSCAVVATAWLINATLNRWVVCAPVRDDGDDHVARCATAGQRDLAAAMLREGLAVRAPAAADEPQIRDYESAEQQARKSYRGLWSSTFQMPWDWRAAHPAKPQTASTAEANR